MTRFTLAAAVLLSAATGSARAVIFTMIMDPRNEDEKLVKRARDDPRGEALANDMAEFGERLVRIARRDPDGFLPFGRRGPEPGKEFALPAAEARGFGVSGSGREGAKHALGTDTYHFGDVGAVNIHRDIMGYPAVAIFYLRVDDRFVSLRRARFRPEPAVGARLAWDRSRFERLRRVALTEFGTYSPWRLDPAGPAGMVVVPPPPMLGGYLSTALADQWAPPGPYETATWGEGHRNGSVRRWKDGTGRVVREVRYLEPDYPPPGLAIEFTEWFPGGGFWRYDAWSDHLKWHRDGGGLVREEQGEFRDGRWRSHRWVWYGRNGRPVRAELDRDEDGVPDTVSTPPDGKDPSKLDVAESWAVHPELIPADRRVPDQDRWRVPVAFAPEEEPAPIDVRAGLSRAALWVGGAVVVTLLVWLTLRSTSARKSSPRSQGST